MALNASRLTRWLTCTYVINISILKRGEFQRKGSINMWMSMGVYISSKKRHAIVWIWKAIGCWHNDVLLEWTNLWDLINGLKGNMNSFPKCDEICTIICCARYTGIKSFIVIYNWSLWYLMYWSLGTYYRFFSYCSYINSKEKWNDSPYKSHGYLFLIVLVLWWNHWEKKR